MLACGTAPSSLQDEPRAKAPVVPVQGRWTALTAGHGVRARDGHVSCAVPDGGALVFGGLIGGAEVQEVVYIAPPSQVADNGTLGVVVEVNQESCSRTHQPHALRGARRQSLSSSS